MATAPDLIGSVPLFAGLEPSLQRRLGTMSEVVSAAPDQVLSRQGAMPEFLHILLDGQVALLSTAPDGTTAVVEVLHPLDHFVLTSVLTKLPSLMTARTVTRSRLLAIDAAGLLVAVESEPQLANALLRWISHEFRTMVRQVRDLKLRTTAQRLGCYLLARVSDAEALRAEFRLPLDKGLLAARLGCRQENLSRAFASLRAHGVETHGSRVILHDVPRLRALAQPDVFGGPEMM